jgi:catechol 2,3-dioxygenase-like lactoylglutathione lyase family enzyme
MRRSSELGLDHAGILVTDVSRALAFYRDVLGLEEVPRPTILKNPGAWLQVGSQQLHLIGEAHSGRSRTMNRPYDDEEIATGYGNHVALVVGSLDEMLARIRANGIEPSIPLARGDGVRRAFITDPDDHIVELMETGVEVTGDEPSLYGPGDSR